MKIKFPKKSKPKKECPHEWTVVTKTYAPPTKGPLPADVSVMEKAIMGVTSYMWQCPVCNALKTTEMLGSDTTQLSEVCDKVEILGPQYIQMNGMTYVISRWTKPADQITVR